MFQFPPPQPYMPLDPPGPVMQCFACFLVVIATVEMIAFILPDKWRDRISAVQFGRRWIAKRRGNP